MLRLAGDQVESLLDELLPVQVRELRELTRYRKTQIQERTREVQRLDKVLQDAGIKLSSVATDIIGVSGRAMLEALVAGTHDPEVLAALEDIPEPRVGWVVR